MAIITGNVFVSLPKGGVAFYLPQAQPPGRKGAGSGVSLSSLLPKEIFSRLPPATAQKGLFEKPDFQSLKLMRDLLTQDPIINVRVGSGLQKGEKKKREKIAPEEPWGVLILHYLGQDKTENTTGEIYLRLVRKKTFQKLEETERINGAEFSLQYEILGLKIKTEFWGFLNPPLRWVQLENLLLNLAGLKKENALLPTAGLRQTLYELFSMLDWLNKGVVLQSTDLEQVLPFCRGVFSRIKELNLIEKMEGEINRLDAGHQEAVPELKGNKDALEDTLKQLRFFIKDIREGLDKLEKSLLVYQEELAKITQKRHFSQEIKKPRPLFENPAPTPWRRLLQGPLYTQVFSVLAKLLDERVKMCPWGIKDPPELYQLCKLYKDFFPEDPQHTITFLEDALTYDPRDVIIRLALSFELFEAGEWGKFIRTFAVCRKDYPLGRHLAVRFFARNIDPVFTIFDKHFSLIYLFAAGRCLGEERWNSAREYLEEVASLEEERKWDIKRLAIPSKAPGTGKLSEEGNNLKPMNLYEFLLYLAEGENMDEIKEYLPLIKGTYTLRAETYGKMLKELKLEKKKDKFRIREFSLLKRAFEIAAETLK